MRTIPFLIYTVIILITFIPVIIVGFFLELKTLSEWIFFKKEILEGHREPSYHAY
jgi:hypothetical protein